MPDPIQSDSQNLDSAAYDQALKDYLRIGEKRATEAEKQAEENRPIEESIKNTAAENARIAREAKPTYAEIPKPPNTQAMIQPTNIQKIFAISSIFSLFAAGITKDRAALGLTGLAGFMKGANEGNLQQANAALADYNNNFRWALETNRIITQQYKDILLSNNMNLEAKEQALRIKMLENHDQGMADVIRQGNLSEVIKYIENRDKVAVQMQQTQLRTQELEERLKILQQNSGLASQRLDLEQQKIDVEREKLRQQKTGTSSQDRMALSSLLTAYNKQITELQKEKDSYWVHSPPPELTSELQRLKDERDKVQKRLSDIGQVPSAPNVPPTAPNAPNKAERLKQLGF